MAEKAITQQFFFGLRRKHMVQPGVKPGTSASLGGGPPQKTSKSRIKGKLLNTTQRLHRKKVAQRERGSDEAKKPEN